MSSPAARADLIASLWEEIRSTLERRQEAIYEAIRDYPPPIPACDAHYNHLLEERTRIAGELGRVRHALSRSDAPSTAELEAFVEASAFLDDGARVRVLERLE